MLGPSSEKLFVFCLPLPIDTMGATGCFEEHTFKDEPHYEPFKKLWRPASLRSESSSQQQHNLFWSIEHSTRDIWNQNSTTPPFRHVSALSSSCGGGIKRSSARPLLGKCIQDKGRAQSPALHPNSIPREGHTIMTEAAFAMQGSCLCLLQKVCKMQKHCSLRSQCCRQVWGAETSLIL